MASQTTNLHLKKPGLDDDALITDINNNMDIIDSAVAGKVDKTTPIKANITGAATGITQNGHYIVDQTNRTVRIYCVARSSSDISSTTVLGNIPAPYRPTEGSTLAGFFYTSMNTALAYYGTVATNGNITQAGGNTMREVLLIGEYIY